MADRQQAQDGGIPDREQAVLQGFGNGWGQIAGVIENRPEVIQHDMVTQGARRESVRQKTDKKDDDKQDKALSGHGGRIIPFCLDTL